MKWFVSLSLVIVNTLLSSLCSCSLLVLGLDVVVVVVVVVLVVVVTLFTDFCIQVKIYKVNICIKMNGICSWSKS